jgi:UDP-glucuronate decarboxylase
MRPIFNLPAALDVIVQALKGDPITIYGDGTQTRSFCYVDDLIDGCFRLMENTEPRETGPINLGNPNEFTVLALAETVIRMTGSSSRIEFRPLPDDDPRQRQPDVARAKQTLGWEPHWLLEEGLKPTIAYFKSLTD